MSLYIIILVLMVIILSTWMDLTSMGTRWLSISLALRAFEVMIEVYSACEELN